jgi:lysozyme
MNNDRLTTSLRKHEGFRSTVYTCTPAGKFTIGIGRCIDISVAGAGITQDEAEYLLRQDINRFTAMTRGLIVTFDSLDEVRQETLVELCFNMGPSNLGKFSKMLAAIDVKDWDTAAAELLDSRYAAQVGQRAITLADQLRSGSYK